MNTQSSRLRPASALDSKVETALQCSPDCVKVIDERGTVEFFNENGLCLMEIDDVAEVIGVHWSSLWPEPERAHLNDAFAAAKSTGSAAFQAFCPTAKGTPRWWDVVIRGLPAEAHETKRFIVTSRDITRRVELEQAQQRLSKRLNEIFHAGPDVLWDIDLLAQKMWWSEGMLSTFGYAPDQVGDSTQWCHDHMHPDDRERVVESMSDAIANGDLRWEEQFRYRKADGSYLEVLDRGSIIRDIRGDAIRFVGSMQDNTARKQIEERESTLSRELAHRMNNMLAVITGLFNTTYKSSRSLDEFADAFSSRILAMSNAHRALIHNRLEGADLESLAKTQLGPFKGSGRVTVSGPVVSLSLQVAQGLALAINELATNAIKYGSLASTDGQVQLTWRRNSAGDGLILCWQESGGALVTAPQRTGLGSKLIDQGIPGAKVTREFDPSGLICTIALSGEDIGFSEA